MHDLIKILFFSDSHLGFDYPLKPRIDIRRRGEDFFNNHNKVFKHAVDNKFDLIIHGGDFFFRSKIPKQIEAMAYDDLINSAENGIPIMIVPGNHERSRLPGSLLTQHPKINIFDVPRTFTFKIRDTRISISGFPYERNNVRDNFKNIISQTGVYEIDSDIKILCMHHAVQGAVVGPSDYTFRYGEDVINMKDMPDGFDCFLSGHIHRRQILKTNVKKNGKTVPFIYPGSIERTSFAEKDETKGFYELEFTKQNYEWNLSEPVFIELPARPMVDFVFDYKSDDAEAIHTQLRKELSKFDKNSIVRLKCNYESTSKKLTARLIRESAPPTMNVEFRYNFR